MPTNIFQLLYYLSDLDEIWFEDQKHNKFEMATTIFLLTSLTYRVMVKNFNSCVFCLIWMKFCMGANNRPKTTLNKFEMA